ncbi:MAG TPA: DUF2071 domain-containing protein, partial [Pyrinomonadaceae bacterium]|nr:DUF2071 domain-containing protein [Pyrinomonadaceae bacterium]
QIGKSKMKLPSIQGTIRRRILANFRVDPETMQRQLPSRFRPKVYEGFAVAGICMIRLDHIRPKLMPEIVGISSENAAHRVAVLWDEDGATREGVFISRRDTNSQLNLLLGGRIFPGEHHEASFDVQESEASVNITMKSADEAIRVEIDGSIAEELPPTSIFSSLAEASSFFEGGAVGYSVTSDRHRLDGLRLKTKEWLVQPLSVRRVHSSYFSDKEKFPNGSIEFDNALIMRNVDHEWHSVDDLYL